MNMQFIPVLYISAFFVSTRNQFTANWIRRKRLGHSKSTHLIGRALQPLARLTQLDALVDDALLVLRGGRAQLALELSDACVSVLDVQAQLTQLLVWCETVVLFSLSSNTELVRVHITWIGVGSLGPGGARAPPDFFENDNNPLGAKGRSRGASAPPKFWQKYLWGKRNVITIYINFF